MTSAAPCITEADARRILTMASAPIFSAMFIILLYGKTFPLPEPHILRLGKKESTPQREKTRLRRVFNGHIPTG